MSNTNIIILLIILIVGGILFYNYVYKESEVGLDIEIDDDTSGSIDMWIDVYDEDGNYVKTIYPSDEPFMSIQ